MDRHFTSFTIENVDFGYMILDLSHRKIRSSYIAFSPRSLESFYHQIQAHLVTQFVPFYYQLEDRLDTEFVTVLSRLW